MRPSPRTVPMATRMAGVMRLFWKVYFTRNTIPRKRTKPPIQAKSFTPRNASQSIGCRGGGGGTSGGGNGDGGGGNGADDFSGGGGGAGKAVGTGSAFSETVAGRGTGGG